MLQASKTIPNPNRQQQSPPELGSALVDPSVIQSSWWWNNLHENLAHIVDEQAEKIDQTLVASPLTAWALSLFILMGIMGLCYYLFTLKLFEDTSTTKED